MSEQVIKISVASFTKMRDALMGENERLQTTLKLTQDVLTDYIGKIDKLIAKYGGAVSPTTEVKPDVSTPVETKPQTILGTASATLSPDEIRERLRSVSQS